MTEGFLLCGVIPRRYKKIEETEKKLNGWEKCGVVGHGNAAQTWV
jgi:hypothetical protein